MQRDARAFLSKIDPQTAGRIPDAAQIVAFRNRLIHGYAHVNDAMVWATVQDSLPQLQVIVAGLLEEQGAP